MNVCPKCFSNSILERRITEIRPSFPDGQKCDLHPNRKGVPLEEIGKIIDPALRGNYTIGEWMFDHQAGDDLYTVVSETTGAEEDEVISSLVSWLTENDTYWPQDGEEAFYADDQSYVRLKPDGWHHSSLWRRFREEILFRQRFFSETARELLRDIFDGIQNQTDIAGKPAFYRLDPEDGMELFRARLIGGDADYKEIAADPASRMGAPPAHLRRAGRMNAAGIAVFYGATDTDTAIAELRPAVGAFVCIATFKLRRPLHVLDLTRFTRPGKQIDIFAKNQVKRSTQWAFMQSFSNEISKPILPGDEHLEYVPAQVVAEYLARHPMKWRGEEVAVEAIIFRSAQNPSGKNIAIVGDAAEAIRSDDAGHSFSPSPSSNTTDFDIFEFATMPRHPPTPGLELDGKSLTQFEITAARFGREQAYFPSAEGPDDF